MKEDKEVILTALDSLNIFVNDADKMSIRDIYLNFIKQCKEFIQFIPTSLKDDQETMLSAVMENNRALQYASESLKNDKEIALTVVSRMSINKSSSISVRQIYVGAVKQKYDFLQYAPKT